MSTPDQVLFSRGATRIHLRRGADRRFWLRVNDGEPTPIEPRELADLLYDWVFYLRAEGVEIAPLDPNYRPR